MSITAVKAVDPRSPAHRAGVRPGETLTHINGHPIVDVLDYKFYSYDPRLELTLKSPDGASRTLHLRKSEGEDLGLEFETYLMDRARSCANHCIFRSSGFVGPSLAMRPPYYSRTDDARRPSCWGNYLTLTNTSRAPRRDYDARAHLPHQRLVHTTTGPCGTRMLKNPRAGRPSASWSVRPGKYHHELIQMRRLPRLNDARPWTIRFRTWRGCSGVTAAVGECPWVPKYRERAGTPAELYQKDRRRPHRPVETFAAKASDDWHRLRLVSDEFLPPGTAGASRRELL